MTLKSIFEILAKKGFIMPHNSYIVNMAMIDKIAGYRIIMSNGDILPVSQKRSVQTRNTYKLYNKKIEL